MKNQKDGVFAAICSVLKVKVDHVFDAAVELTKPQRTKVTEIVAKGFHSGEIAMSDDARAKYSSEELLRTKYVPGLLNNWLRKDKRLNGNTTYQPKNPGSRTGSQDPLIRELKKLRATVTDDPKKTEAVQQEIDKRMAAIQAEKAKSIEINAELLPEHLRKFVANS